MAVSALGKTGADEGRRCSFIGFLPSYDGKSSNSEYLPTRGGIYVSNR